MEQNNPQSGYSITPQQPQDSFVVKKQNKAGLYLVLTIVAVVLIGGLVMVFGQRFLPGKTTAPGSRTADMQNEAIEKPLPTPSGMIKEVSPWPQAATELPQEPPLPTKEEMDQQYRRVRLAITSRDYAQIQRLVSAERLWYIDHPKRIIGSMQTEGQYYEITGQGGEINFIHAPYSILFDAPPEDAMVPQAVSRKEVVSRPDIYVTDPKTGTTEKVHMTSWRYAIDLQYKTASGYAEPGTGMVTFVYDTGKWAFQGQSWNLTRNESIENKGDSPPAGVALHNITIGDNGACNPLSATIRSGEAVRWGAITGMLYTIAPAVSHWDSGFLYKDTYTKKFTKPGTYTYVVQQPPRDPSGYTQCTIIVE